MVAFVRSLRTRWRLRLAWTLTRHPRFKPIYPADVISFDLIVQAEFLCNAGYHYAAAMLTRAAIESTIKRLVCLTPTWRQYQGEAFGDCLKFLADHEVIDADLAARCKRFYRMASRVVHGDYTDHGRCWSCVADARGIKRLLDKASKRVLKMKPQRPRVAWRLRGVAAREAVV